MKTFQHHHAVLRLTWLSNVASKSGKDAASPRALISHRKHSHPDWEFLAMGPLDEQWTTDTTTLVPTFALQGHMAANVEYIIEHRVSKPCDLKSWHWIKVNSGQPNKK